MLQKSYRTRTSELTLEFIKSKNERGFTAAELSDFLKKNGLDVNKTTVYRNLDRLTESGSLVKHKSHVSDGYVYQQADEDCAEHIHFQCSRCGSVIHLSDRSTVSFLTEISEKLGFEIDMTCSSLNGLCRKCKDNGENNA